MQDGMHIVVVGGGVAGLGSALTLARRGHRVTLVERDDTPMPQTADEAFEWNRRGAPQVRHSHAFLARLVGILRRDYPDIYDALLAEGASEMRFGDDLPPGVTNFERQPDDDELVMLACRRTTFEWVLRRAVLAEGNVGLRTGLGVRGVVVDTSAQAQGDDDRPPHVVGVMLDDGTELRGDLVVVAAGRRSALADWLVTAGCPPVVEHTDDTGIVYLSRFYRLREDAEFPPRGGPIGGDLGYLKYGVFAGDNRTFSVTLAVSNSDEELRRLLADPERFETCCRLLSVTAPWLDGRAVPITVDGSDDVHLMAGLVNRWREFVVDGEPVAVGVIPVGDAVLCTNPLYGRGCSTAFWGATLMADAVAAHIGRPREAMLAYDEALRREIYPWYKASVDNDAEARRVSAALLAGDDPDGDTSDPRTLQRSVFREGLLPAMRSDAVVLRAFFRTFNLLCAPDAMLHDTDVTGRVFAVWQDRDNRPPEPSLGPRRRADLLELMV
jgi:2-polyprenyl-6-methoxyphenol hydroxylase-like FAD-dependent oxidoreductase